MLRKKIIRILIILFLTLSSLFSIFYFNNNMISFKSATVTDKTTFENSNKISFNVGKKLYENGGLGKQEIHATYNSRNVQGIYNLYETDTPELLSCFSIAQTTSGVTLSWQNNASSPFGLGTYNFKVDVRFTDNNQVLEKSYDFTLSFLNNTPNGLIDYYNAAPCGIKNSVMDTTFDKLPQYFCYTKVLSKADNEVSIAFNTDVPDHLRIGFTCNQGVGVVSNAPVGTNLGTFRTEGNWGINWWDNQGVTDFLQSTSGVWWTKTTGISESYTISVSCKTFLAGHESRRSWIIHVAFDPTLTA